MPVFRSGVEQQRLLRVLADPDASFMDAARVYQRMLASDGRVDWSVVTTAVAARWGEDGLERMRRNAWDIYAGGVAS